jgi:glucuronokinase
VATLRALMEFYGVEIPKRVQPSLVLSVETEELGIAAGLQDRVIQVHEGLVYMDFAEEKMESIAGLRCGVYEPLDPALLPPLYVAYSTEASEPTEVIHNNLRERFSRGEPAVVEAMARLAELTVEARSAILARDTECLGRCINKNFDLRQSICRLAKPHERMVQRARETGATASYTGSGGAIVGTYRDEAMFGKLQEALEPLHCRVIRPQIVENAVPSPSGRGLG